MTGLPAEERPLNIKALLGIGLDGEPGQTRITRGEDFFLYGGSKGTHQHMQETVLRFKDKVDRRGKTLAEINARELHEIGRELLEER